MCNRLKHGGYGGIDILKLCLSYIVLLRHAGQVFYDTDSMYYFVFVNWLSPIAVPTFFVLSGFLFFRKERKIADFKKQLLRVSYLYLGWSAIYFPITFFSWYKSGDDFLTCVWEYLKDAILVGTYYHLWYLPALAIALAMVYWLRRHVSNINSFLILFVVYILGLFGDSYKPLLGDFALSFVNGYNNLFLTTRNGFIFGSLFVLLGGILADNEEKIVSKYKNKSGYLFGLLIICIGLLFLESYLLNNISNGRINNMLLFTVLACMVLSIIAIRASTIFKKSYNVVKEMSTLIFFTHPWIIFMTTLVDYLFIYLSNKRVFHWLKKLV